MDRLKQEFCQLDADIVVSVYASLNNNYEQTRSTLREMTGKIFDLTKDDNNTAPENSHYSCLQELQGDLFSCSPTASLCHCVSQDFAMGKGIAVQFKQKFGSVDNLKSQQAGIGQAAVLLKPNGDAIENKNAFVYYLVTKPRYFDKPTYESLQQSCEWMRNHALREGVECIAMPRIGCGLDGLEWPRVKQLIQHVFSVTGITIQVYKL